MRYINKCVDTKFFSVFSGNSNCVLSSMICQYLNVSTNNIIVNRFSDGEISVEINDDVNGNVVFVVQSICNPVNDNLMELLLIIDALKRASARSIVAVVPYYGYARQDRRVSGVNSPISARLVADMLTVAGVSRVVTVDLHSIQIEGFFKIPVCNLSAMSIFCDYVGFNFDVSRVVVVSPDIGGIKRARGFADKLNCGLAVVDKQRSLPNEISFVNLIGEVANKIVIICDDIVDTAGTLINVVDVLIKHGADEVYVCCTHAVLSGPALDRIMMSPVKKVFVTDTVPLGSKVMICNKLEVLSVSNLIGEAIATKFVGCL